MASFFKIYHRALASMGGEGGGGGSSSGQPTSWSFLHWRWWKLPIISAPVHQGFFYAHTQFIVVGRETAEKNLADILLPLSFKDSPPQSIPSFRYIGF